MIVYAKRRRRIKTHTYSHNWRDALIRYGEVEAAIADSLCPARDEPHPFLEQLRTIAIRVAAGELEALAQVPPIPDEITSAVPEGYAYYGVYPEDYGRAAIRFFREVQPKSVVVNWHPKYWHELKRSSRSSSKNVRVPGSIVHNPAPRPSL